MISIYEAVVPAAATQQKPVPGAVVPQTKSQQQPQTSHVPEQKTSISQQTVQQIQQQPQQNSTTVSSVQQNIPQSSNQQTTDQKSEPSWKKYLKYGGLIGAGLALGGGIYGVANNWDYIKTHMLPGASGPVPENDGEWADNDNGGSETKAVGTAKRVVQGNISHTPTTFSKPDPWVGPPPQAHIWGGSGRIGGPRDILSYGAHRPANQSQPNSIFGSATMVKHLDQATGRQYYVPRGGHVSSYYFDNSEWADNYPDNSSPSSGIYVRPKRGGSFNPINDYDHGRRSGLY